MDDDSDDSVTTSRDTRARRLFPRRIDSLSALFAFAADCYVSHDVPEEKRNLADFVIEELFTNFVKYNATGAGEIEVGLGRSGALLEISLVDFDSERFDLREAREVSIDAPLSERTPGGLGIHLVKKFAKRIDYDYDNRKSTITIYLDLG